MEQIRAYPSGPLRPRRGGAMGDVGTPGVSADGSPYKYRDFFAYEVDFASLAAAASATATFTIQADSDFIWQKATYQADLAGGAQTSSGVVIPLMTILITDSGAGRQLMSSAIPVTNLFGTGQLPFIMPRPRVFRSQSTVTVQVTNYSAATAYLLRLSFIGEKGFWA